jgi:hypothetical protein
VQVTGSKKGKVMHPRTSADIDRIIETGRAKEVIYSHMKDFAEIEQILGKALGYPWFKDDQKNFPGATEENGVCVGEHIPVTIATEAATKIRRYELILRFVLPFCLGLLLMDLIRH